jgi:hypothetical protein
MKDFLGNNLEVGDIVVMMRPNYRELIKAKILRFTKCFAVLSYKTYSDYDDEIKQDPRQLIKIPLIQKIDYGKK